MISTTEDGGNLASITSDEGFVLEKVDASNWRLTVGERVFVVAATGVTEDEEIELSATWETDGEFQRATLNGCSLAVWEEDDVFRLQVIRSGSVSSDERSLEVQAKARAEALALDGTW